MCGHEWAGKHANRLLCAIWVGEKGARESADESGDWSAMAMRVIWRRNWRKIRDYAYCRRCYGFWRMFGLGEWER